jgi:multicomponent Na+:H+ antiporter subunit G
MAEFFSLIATAWDTVRFPLGGFICLAGALLCIVGTIGVLRFPDFYTRLHAASMHHAAVVHHGHRVTH